MELHSSTETGGREACDFCQAITSLPVPDEDVRISDKGEKGAMNV